MQGSVPESTLTIDQWEALIAQPPEPDHRATKIEHLRRQLENNELTLEERSTLLRTLAYLESLQPNADFLEIKNRLSTAIQVAQILPPEQAAPYVAKARLNQSALARRFMEKELQKAVLYGLKQEDFFRIMATYYQPAQTAIKQGMEHTEDPLMQLHFHLAASSLAYTFAHCTQAFTHDSPSSMALFKASAAEARTVLSGINSCLEDQKALSAKELAVLASLRRSALNNLAATALYISLPDDALNNLLNDLVRAAEDPDCPLRDRVACYSTALHIARTALPMEARDAFLATTTPPATALFNSILGQQKNISAALAGGSSMLSLLDEFSHFVSTLVLSLLDQGETEQAFEIVRRSKWSTLSSLIAPPVSDFDALIDRLEARDALLVEQFLSHEGLVQFLLSGEAPLSVVRNEQNSAHSLASGVAEYFTAASQASPVRLLLRNRPQLYTDFLMQGQSLYVDIFETSGIDREFSRYDEILIAPHLILAYIP